MATSTLGAKLVLQFSTSFMPTTVHNCLTVLKNGGVLNGNVKQTSAYVADQLRLNHNATERFLNAATSLGILERDHDGNYYNSTEPPKMNSKSSEVMFWLIRSNAVQLLFNSSATSVEQTISTLPQGIEMLNTAIEEGIIRRTSSGLEINKEISEYLNPNSPRYMGLWIQNYDRIASKIFSEIPLLEALKTGTTQWQTAFGADVTNAFDLADTNPNLFRDLMEGMHQANIVEGQLFSRSLDFTGVKNVLDIGGASGGWAISLAKENPSIAAITIYELDKAVPLYLEMYKRYTAGETYPISYTEGNFLKATSANTLYGLKESDKFDLITLGWILHDWQDDNALTILKKARNHINPNGRMLLAEAILPDNRLGPNTLLDLTMLLQTGGMERTQKEYAHLLELAGFKLTETIDLGTRRHLLVAVPIEN